MLKKCLHCGTEKDMRKTVSYCSISCSKIGKKAWNKGTIGVCSAWNKGKKLSLAHRKQLSIAHTGKILSKQHKENISKGSLNKVLTAEHRKNLSISLRNKKLSSKTKIKISKTLKEYYKVNKNPMQDKHLSSEARLKISKANIGKSPWNFGLNKENDSRVLAYSKKCGWSKGLTKYTSDSVRKMSISLARVATKKTSQTEKEVYKELLKINDKIIHQFQIMWYTVDFKLKKKIIEYNGCYYHACPICCPEYRNDKKLLKSHLKVKRNLEIEPLRAELLTKLGYSTFIIWEHEWANDKYKVLDDVKRFLDDGN